MNNCSYLLCPKSFRILLFFFFNDTATTEIYTLSLHDALPIRSTRTRGRCCAPSRGWVTARRDRKSTRLNSSHLVISYAVFCLKKKKKNNGRTLHYKNQAVDKLEKPTMNLQ